MMSRSFPRSLAVALVALLTVASASVVGVGAAPLTVDGSPAATQAGAPADVGPGPVAQTDDCPSQEADIGPERVTTGPIYPDVGETVTTRVNLTNRGQTAGEFTIELYIDGSVAQQHTLQVPACGEASHTFSYSFQERGNHTIGLNWENVIHEVDVGGEGGTGGDGGTGSDGGDGGVGGLTIEPSSLEFGRTDIGSGPTRTVTLTNGGDQPITGLRPVLPGGENATDFPVLTQGPRTLEPGESWDVRVRFRPREPGRTSTTLGFRNGDGEEVGSVALQGWGVGPDVRVSPVSLSFADATVGERSEKTFTVRNVGSGSVTVDALDLLGGGDFEVITDPGFTLGPDQQRRVTVAFTPSSERPQSTSLRVGTAEEAVAEEIVWLSSTRATASVELGQSANRTWMNVDVVDAEAGEPVAVQVPDREGEAGATLQQLAVTPRVSGNFTLNATDSEDPLASSPVFRLGDGTTPLDYLSVDHSIRNEDVTSATLTVRVSKERLEALNTRPEEVSLYRYNGTAWAPQPTRVRSQTDTHVVLAATASGFSQWTAAAKRPRFNISEKSTSIDTGVVGDVVTIRVFVSNTGGADGVYVAELLLNGEVVDRREATIPDGGKRALNFERSFEQPGQYEIRVNDVFVGTVNISGGNGSVDVGTTEPGGNGSQAGGGGGPPLIVIVLLIGAIALVVAYIRYSGRPPGMGPQGPPEPPGRPSQGGQSGQGSGMPEGGQGGGQPRGTPEGGEGGQPRGTPEGGDGGQPRGTPGGGQPGQPDGSGQPQDGPGEGG